LCCFVCGGVCCALPAVYAVLLTINTIRPAIPGSCLSIVFTCVFSTEAGCTYEEQSGKCVWPLWGSVRDCSVLRSGPAECEALVGCWWCDSQSKCVSSYSRCTECRGFDTEPHTCAMQTGCAYCSARLQCTTEQECVQCSELDSPSVCGAHAGCMFCAESNMCVDQAQGCTAWSQNSPKIDVPFPWNCGNEECPSVCGDGRVTGSEKCDDGNFENGDGCSDVCEREDGLAPEVGLLLELCVGSWW
jgi:cysteine-rich repeat protein